MKFRLYNQIEQFISFKLTLHFTNKRLVVEILPLFFAANNRSLSTRPYVIDARWSPYIPKLWLFGFTGGGVFLDRGSTEFLLLVSIGSIRNISYYFWVNNDLVFLPSSSFAVLPRLLRIKAKPHWTIQLNSTQLNFQVELSGVQLLLRLNS